MLTRFITQENQFWWKFPNFYNTSSTFFMVNISSFAYKQAIEKKIHRLWSWHWLRRVRRCDEPQKEVNCCVTANALEIEVRRPWKTPRKFLTIYHKKKFKPKLVWSLAICFQLFRCGLTFGREHWLDIYVRGESNRVEFMCAEVVLELLRQLLIKKNFWYH